MKIALFGGTFDPVHNGHVNAALEVLKQGIVDEVWFIPVQWHAFKENSFLTSLEHRAHMLKLAIEGEPDLKVVDLNDNPTYTLDTILKAKKFFLKNEYFWLMGTNLMEEFSIWKNPKKILQEVKLILFPVPGKGCAKSKLIDSSNPIRVKADEIDLSSTLVRGKLKKCEDVSNFLDSKVVNYIKENSLYSACR